MIGKYKKWLLWGLVLVSFIGFLDASYLTLEHFKGGSVACIIAEGCDEVNNSQWAEFFGIPTALFGVLFYLFIFIISVVYIDTRKKALLKTLVLFSTCGLIFSAFFVYLQLFEIEAICSYCMVSAVTSTLLFILSLTIFKNAKTANKT